MRTMKNEFQGVGMSKEKRGKGMNKRNRSGKKTCYSSGVARALWAQYVDEAFTDRPRSSVCLRGRGEQRQQRRPRDLLRLSRLRSTGDALHGGVTPKDVSSDGGPY
ncbi:hypothetical protein HPB50_007972 [Hyalomma asiaticum]|uniref:Uncharacterized protein n=1 Tax=Hyalomma asiaticum TaxID=266040 RepID=A0ACB7T8I8_HYAAI|nr:hypothetical protein HPB50_007972 [Hyalomma asiaticum]